MYVVKRAEYIHFQNSEMVSCLQKDLAKWGIISDKRVADQQHNREIDVLKPFKADYEVWRRVGPQWAGLGKPCGEESKNLYCWNKVGKPAWTHRLWEGEPLEEAGDVLGAGLWEASLLLMGLQVHPAPWGARAPIQDEYWLSTLKYVCVCVCVLTSGAHKGIWEVRSSMSKIMLWLQKVPSILTFKLQTFKVVNLCAINTRHELTSQPALRLLSLTTLPLCHLPLLSLLRSVTLLACSLDASHCTVWLCFSKYCTIKWVFSILRFFFGLFCAKTIISYYATAKSLQSCPTLCDPIPGIL